MRYSKILAIAIVCMFRTAILPAQEHHDHEHQRNEIGFSGGAIYTFDHKTWGGGVHLHYFRTLGVHSKWSLGGGFEQVWIEGNHFTLGAGVKYQVIDRLSIGILPGVTFFKHDEHDSTDEHDDSGYHSRFSAHLEVVYDLFHWEKLHMGPTIDYSWAKNDSHIMVGIHAAFCF